VRAAFGVAACDGAATTAAAVGVAIVFARAGVTPGAVTSVVVEAGRTTGGASRAIGVTGRGSRSPSDGGTSTDGGAILESAALSSASSDGLRRSAFAFSRSDADRVRA
jgi:hypothetical protein